MTDLLKTFSPKISPGTSAGVKLAAGGSYALTALIASCRALLPRIGHSLNSLVDVRAAGKGFRARAGRCKGRCAMCQTRFRRVKREVHGFGGGASAGTPCGFCAGAV